MDRASSTFATPTGGRHDNRMVATMRLILACSALVIIYLDPSEPDRFAAAVYTLLILYTLYSAAIWLLVLRQSRLVKAIIRWGHWADIGWYTVLLAFSSGTHSFFFFAILMASFRWGFRQGLGATTVSAVSFIVVSLLAHPREVDFALNRFLLRAVSLLLLGYMMAYWGESELALKRRLALLKEISRFSNPRFGVDRTIGALLERLRAFYDAESCLLIMAEADASAFTLRRADRHDPEAATHPQPSGAELARKLLALPARSAATYYCRRGSLRGGGCEYYLYDCAEKWHTSAGRAEVDTLGALLDAVSFVTVPLAYYRAVEGRLFLTARQRFKPADVDFLLQVVEQFLPVVDNVRLVDRLASDAAEDERRRIARDIHDSIIQPYIGLQIGLAAVQRKLASGDGTVVSSVEQLHELAEAGITDLRCYVAALKDGVERDGSLRSAIQRFAAKFAAATGIAVEVQAADCIEVNDRFAAEIFQIVAEGLSNVRRHTQAARVTVGLTRHLDQFIVRIENEGGREPVSFIPRSISARAAALGGQARVEAGQHGGAAVTVEIPL